MAFPSSWRYLVLAAAVASLALLALVAASTGDRAQPFQICVRNCELDVCHVNDPNPTTESLPRILRVFFWTCSQNCRYECMQAITSTAQARGEPIQQYYGKWPFYRLLGIQEPASVLFSILNGYAHYVHWRPVRERVRRDYFMRPWYLAYILVSCNTWVWSTVFHTRDFNWTEKMDYFSAGFSVLFMLLVALVRTFRLSWPDRAAVLRPLVAVFLLAFGAHVAYLSLWRFDYGYNMLANVLVGLLCNVVWITWSFRNRHVHPAAWQPTLCVLLISAAMSLELFDFPPLFGILDAHSLWHLATIRIVYIFYAFLLQDAEWDYKQLHAKH
ncbi:hypothetical protein IWQ60_006458 [Tieghemiomyces parasiticus]|uniref:Post-GPI attachment to proteins factor 3 n=1 Tax=Tieghemiomyces parasiticus TaxID=78921 RepID=A0A9W8A4X7_9FUNG|nr:hypothetical protein IWQ60_006458 [Tieghemiomyces parasiticus]